MATMAARVCLNCMAKFDAKLSDVNRGQGKFCCRSCSSSWSNRNSPAQKAHWKKAARREKPGAANINWKGGRTRHSKGYILLHVPDHPHASKKGYVMEHILVMEEHLGRYLLPDELVHHKDEVKDNNKVSNLEVTTILEHNRLHRQLIDPMEVKLLLENGWTKKRIAAKLKVKENSLRTAMVRAQKRGEL